MSDEEKSAVKLLFYECQKYNPNMSMIDEYIHRCCNNNEDINKRFQYFYCFGTTLHMASRMGHHLVIRKLLDTNNTFQFPIDINATSEPCDRTPLHFACCQYCPLTVQELLQHPNIDVNKGTTARNGKHSLTPLHYACNHNIKSIVIELLKHSNIQITARESWSKIPLHLACEYSDVDIDLIRMLLDYKPEIYRIEQLTAKDISGSTPLHKACCLSHSAHVVQLLLEYANIIDVNATTDICGNTPLHYACSTYHKSSICMIKYLLEQPNINVQIKTKHRPNETPFDIVKRQRLEESNNCINEKQYFNDIIHLFESYQYKQRWRIYCFLIQPINITK